jgi:GNAT superfamily N-acetyltransferase
MTLSIRKATKKDVPAMHALTVALAEYERKRPEEILVTQDKLRKWGFGPNKKFETMMALWDGKPVGLAIYFYTYAGSLGEPILYIEDLFVLPEFRRRHIGTKMLQWLAQRALDDECCRMQWAVFDWNEQAIAFYRALGATIRSDLPQVRMDTQVLQAFLSHSK